MTKENVFEEKLTPEQQWAKVKEDVAQRMQNDPLIKEHMDAQRAIEESRGKPQPKESPFMYDDNGNLLGVKPEFKNKVSPYEQMKAIQENTQRKFGGQ